ncbi:electron transfer flavoprotein subunit beta/FixA family protein [Candidatus Liberibacter americanus]|uniref:Electron transfer flavoprotein subunit beta n=1 Tax=Candidatus Liberibacter americanus str. Sao Paulo TaxID=1261131 RepID=U6B706_9HYPH|nr:electron transfer flavoprotein subunit beta/FixA family protein [Candidatus Liberibacter americanus]AHA27651.1 Electron transfer flavoprotein beta-subunit [Candidatus Liberibacter americanus str. Sao Paulo]EMS36360.1 electron transfer flavoprotein beta subunit [Candidatus Liberibacter americanus PW_SP]
MKVLVPIKGVIDYNANIRVKVDGSGIEKDNLKTLTNPFDEVAIEEALRLKEKVIADEVIAVSIGACKTEEILKNALAMGADRAIFIESKEILEPLSVAKLLREIVNQEKPKIVITGKKTTDYESNQTGQMLAALMKWPQATFASSIEIDKYNATIIREMGYGIETIEVTLPAVITVDLNLNDPRYISLSNMMKSRKKIIEKKIDSDFLIDLKPHLKTLNFEENKIKRSGIRLNSALELIEILKNKHGLL